MEKCIIVRKKKTERDLTMGKWRFFPILVKEEIVKNMRIQDIISFAKCSKQCQNLLTFVPIHLPSALINDHRQIFLGPRLNLDLDLISLDHFSILATSRKFFVDKFEIYFTTEKYKQDLKDLIKKLTKARKSLKVKKLSMNFEIEHAELFTGILGICDPTRIESIQILNFSSQEVYEELVKTPQWKNCKKVLLNDMFYQRLTMPNVNIVDFLHFENVKLLVERLDSDDAVKFVQNFRYASEHAKFVIECRERIQQDLIRQKIEAGLDGNWQQAQARHSTIRFVIDPAKPDHVFYVKYSPFCLYGEWSPLEEFNVMQEIIRLFLAYN